MGNMNLVCLINYYFYIFIYLSGPWPAAAPVKMLSNRGHFSVSMNVKLQIAKQNDSFYQMLSKLCRSWSAPLCSQTQRSECSVK